ncbi:MAG: ATPase [Planctomycetaceae bacterium]|nr:ATPase [Planctomycetaceae bacterium]
MRRIALAAGLFLASIFVLPAQAAPPEESFESLLRRLEATERRLEELERENSQFDPAPLIRPVTFPNAAPPLIPPSKEDSDSADGDKKKDGDEKKDSDTSEDGDAKDEKDKDKDKEKEPTLEERLKKLEEGWKELDEAWTSFEKAEKKKKDDAAKKPTFKINGRIHADYWDFLSDDAAIGFFENPNALIDGAPNPQFGADPEDRFAFRRIRLEMGGDILEPMLWRVQIDFNNPGTPEMKDVYLGFKNLPNNQTLLIGNQKRPFGLDHLNSSRYNVFLERPFVVEAFNEDARRPGVCMYGHTDDLVYNWRYGVFYLDNINTTGRYNGDVRQMSGNFRLASSPWYDDASDGRGYFHWAVAGVVAKPDGNAVPSGANANEGRFRTRPEARSDSRWLDTGRIPGADWYEIAAVESIFNVGPLQITGEYMHNFMQRSGAFQDVSFHGGYVYVSYMLTGEHIPYDREDSTLDRLKPFENFFFVDRCGGGTASGLGAWGIAARYSYLDVTDADVLGGVGQSVTGALNWYWTPYSKVQFNLIYGDIDSRAVAGFSSGNYLIAGTRFAIEF